MTAPSPAGLSPLLDQLDEARAAATPGPWKIRDDGVTVEIEGGDRESVRDKHGFYDADAALIVAAVNALPTLIRLAREREALRQAVAELADELVREAREEAVDGQPTRSMLLARVGAQIERTITAALTPGADTAGATA